MAVAARRQTYLLEATRKKCAFLERWIADSGLRGVSVSCGRAEDLASDPLLAGKIAAVVARALAELPVLVELATPFLAHEGLLLAMKGRITQEEVDRGDSVARRTGLSRVALERYTLPGGEEQRALVTYRRTGDSDVRLPRRAGMAKKRPLA